jgi:8-hydroxy-5-deazaflavin:NADPH oxidoreductase
LCEPAAFLTLDSMRIAILGAGNVGGALARLWTEAGYDVQTARSTGHPTPAEIGPASDVVAVCVPWQAAESALAACGGLSGKVIIDCTNPLAPNLEGLLVGGTTSAAERIQQLYPDASVVKAFNSVGAGLFGAGAVDGFFCGDDAAAKQKVEELVAAARFRPVDVGPLRNARYLEAMAMLWIDMAVNQGKGGKFSFGLVQR